MVGDEAVERERGLAPLLLLHGGPGACHDYLESLPDDLGEPASAGAKISADFTSLQWFELPAACLK